MPVPDEDLVREVGEYGKYSARAAGIGTEIAQPLPGLWQRIPVILRNNVRQPRPTLTDNTLP